MMEDIYLNIQYFFILIVVTQEEIKNSDWKK